MGRELQPMLPHNNLREARLDLQARLPLEMCFSLFFLCFLVPNVKLFVTSML